MPEAKRYIEWRRLGTFVTTTSRALSRDARAKMEAASGAQLRNLTRWHSFNLICHHFDSSTTPRQHSQSCFQVDRAFSRSTCASPRHLPLRREYCHQSLCLCRNSLTALRPLPKAASLPASITTATALLFTKPLLYSNPEPCLSTSALPSLSTFKPTSQPKQQSTCLASSTNLSTRS